MPKRRRGSTHFTHKKKHTQTPSEAEPVEPDQNDQQDPPTEGLGPDCFPVNAIISQKRSLYLLDWAGVDPETGKEYENTWEPKKHIGSSILLAWEKAKAAKAEEKANKRNRRTSQAPKKSQSPIKNSQPTNPPEIKNASPLKPKKFTPKRAAVAKRVSPRKKPPPPTPQRHTRWNLRTTKRPFYGFEDPLEDPLETESNQSPEPSQQDPNENSRILPNAVDGDSKSQMGNEELTKSLSASSIKGEDTTSLQPPNLSSNNETPLREPATNSTRRASVPPNIESIENPNTDCELGGPSSQKSRDLIKRPMSLPPSQDDSRQHRPTPRSNSVEPVGKRESISLMPSVKYSEEPDPSLPAPPMASEEDIAPKEEQVDVGGDLAEGLSETKPDHQKPASALNSPPQDSPNIKQSCLNDCYSPTQDPGISSSVHKTTPIAKLSSSPQFEQHLDSIQPTQDLESLAGESKQSLKSTSESKSPGQVSEETYLTPMSTSDLENKPQVCPVARTSARQDQIDGSSISSTLPSTASEKLPTSAPSTLSMNPPVHPVANQGRPASPPKTPALPAGSPKDQPQPGAKMQTPAHLNENEFFIPLPLGPEIKHAYRQIIMTHYDSIKRFYVTDLKNRRLPDIQNLTEEMQGMLSHLRNIVCHSDLDDEKAPIRQSVSDAVAAEQAINYSTKFQFLRDLFEELKVKGKKNIILVARAGRLLDIMERFLRGKGISYIRPDTPGSKDPTLSGSYPQVTLLPSIGSEFVPTERVNFIIAFDSSFDPSRPEARLMRQNANNAYEVGLVPVIHPVVMNSVEHIELNLRNLPENRKMKRLVEEVCLQREYVGHLPEDIPDVFEKSKEVFAFLDNSNPRTWSLPTKNMYNNKSRSTRTTMKKAKPTRVVGEASGAASQGNTSQRVAGKKRMLENGTDGRYVSSAKRRCIPFLVEDDSEQNFVRALNTEDDCDPRHQIVLLMSLVHRSEDRISKLQAENDAFARRVIDQEYDLSERQYRFEEIFRENARLRAEVSENVTKVASLEETVKNKTTKVDEQRTKIVDLTEELKSARETLHNSPIVELSKLTMFEDRIKELEQEKANALHRLESMQQDFEFTRLEYQRASAAAASQANEATALREQNEVLQKSASGEALKLQQFVEQNADKEYRRHIDRLECENSELKNLLTCKEEQLRKINVTDVTRQPSCTPSSSKTHEDENSDVGVEAGNSVCRSPYLRKVMND